MCGHSGRAEEAVSYAWWVLVVGCCTPNRRRSQREVVLREEGSGRWFPGPFGQLRAKSQTGIERFQRARVS